MAGRKWSASRHTNSVRLAKRSLDVLLERAPAGTVFHVSALPPHLRRAIGHFQALGACFRDRTLLRAGPGLFRVVVVKGGCRH